jgi:ATP-dependent Clp protease ATP-binding subunit ClpC
MSFDRLSQNSIRVINLAGQIAIEERHNSKLDTDDLLVAILGEGSSQAARLIKETGMSFERLIQDLKSSTEKPAVKEPTPSGKVAFTAAANMAIAKALEEATKQKSNVVTPEHLLVGLLSNPTWQATKLLERAKVDVAALLKATNSLSSKNQAQNSPNLANAAGALSQFGRNLTEEAAAGKLELLTGRELEIKELLDILGRRSKNNPIIVGESGVGKTAIMEGLAQYLVSEACPAKFKGKSLFLLDMGAVVSGAKYRGEFEERMRRIIEEVTASGIILCIDEIHTIVGSGAAEGSMDAANLLKPALARGLQTLGSTTLDEYRRIERDPALARRFQRVLVQPPSVEATIQILQGLKPRLEAHHKLTITDEALTAAAKLSDRYITDRHQPDKAIDLVDEAASRLSNSNENGELVLTEENIAAVITRKTGVPVSRLTQSEAQRLLTMEDELHQRVVAQEKAIEEVASAVRRARAGLAPRNKPMASFLFAGPTGVGKTELAKALADNFFGSEEQMIRLDMSEYMERHTVSKLIGSPPGYVGYEDGGQLTEAVRRKPYSVVLFDEVEKAHPDVFNMLLQILDDGRLTDSQGRSVNFKNTIIILTTNCGSRVIESRQRQVGLDLNQGIEPKAREEASYERMQENLMAELKKQFRPELLNRLTAKIAFHQLNREQVRGIIEIMMKEIRTALAERGMQIELTEAAKELILDEGFSLEFGARELRRAIIKLIETPLSVALLSEQFKDGDTILVDAESSTKKEREGNIVLRCKEAKQMRQEKR